MNNMDRRKTMHEKISIILNTSPVSTNRPLKKSNPEQNIINCKGMLYPNKISINEIEAAKSTRPRIFTNIIKMAF